MIKKVFRQLDVNGNGRLGVDEVYVGGQKMNLGITRSDAERMLKKADIDGKFI